MKRFILIFFLTLFCVSSWAEDAYYPLVEEGKVWEYYQVLTGHYRLRRYYRMEFRGTTEIEGVQYHNLYLYFDEALDISQSRPVAYVREEGKKVYARLDEEGMEKVRWSPEPQHIFDETMFPEYTPDEIVIYDFDTFTMPNATIKYFFNEEYRIGPISVEVNGKERRAMKYCYSNTSEYYYLIEGIGHSGIMGGCLLNFGSPGVFGVRFYTQALRCVYNENGDIIFKSDYYDFMTTGVDNLIIDKLKTNGIYYNLLGQPVSNPTSGIYIKDGKKVVVK